MLFKFEESRIYKKYVEPIVRTEAFAGYVFDPDASDTDRAAVGFLRKIFEEKQRIHDCYELDITKLPPNLEYIGDRAFGRCGDSLISYIPDSVTYLGAGAF